MPSVFRLLACALAVAAACATLVAASSESSGLKYERFHLVDFNEVKGVPQFLFRGNFPANATHFEYDTMKEFMQKRAREYSLAFPIDDVYIIDVSLNNIVDEDPLETHFWADPANKAKGRLYQWPIGASSLIRPRDVKPVEERNKQALKDIWAIDQIPDRISTVHDFLTRGTGAPDNRPLAVYVHCTAGCDRTGAFIGSYRMEYMGSNTTMPELFHANVLECGRVPNYFGVATTEWYCVRNELTSQQQLGDCLDIAKCKPFGKCEEH
jgi:hypothetical protein